MKKILGGFGTVTGAFYPLKALRLFWQYPKLRSYIIIPILVNGLVAIALYGGLLFFGFEFIADIQTDLTTWFDGLLTNLPSWLGFLEYGLLGLAFLLRLLLDYNCFNCDRFCFNSVWCLAWCALVWQTFRTD